MLQPAISGLTVVYPVGPTELKRRPRPHGVTSLLPKLAIGGHLPHSAAENEMGMGGPSRALNYMRIQTLSLIRRSPGSGATRMVQYESKKGSKSERK